MNRVGAIAKKYDLTERDFDCTYYSTVNMIKRINGKLDEDLFTKYMFDKLEEQGIEYRDADTITGYYQEELYNYLCRENKPKKSVVEKILESDDDEIPSDIVEEEMQTSGEIDAKIGMNRKKGYKTKVIDMYEDDNDDDIENY